MDPMKGILYLSDLSYEAKGRRYCDEDILVTDYLRTRFNVALCHPSSCAAFEDAADVVVLRNMGAVAGFQDVHDAFCKRAKEKGLVTYNQLTGKADMVGKQYLLDMTDAGMPTIPTVEHISDLGRLPEADRYVIKPKDGADSNGMEFLPRTALLDGKLDEGMLIQPAIDFEYEVSFFFLDGRYEYALYAPDPLKRWELEPYEATGADLDFAQMFIDWNDISHGIQRVDACRTRKGGLLLVELEDLNPYLSLDRVDSSTRERFLEDVASGLERVATESC
jgi:hypothetical protein